jgi:hypothetical protein
MTTNSSIPPSLHEHSCHALIEARLRAADRLTDEGDRREDFSGRHFVECVPTLLRSHEEHRAVVTPPRN